MFREGGGIGAGSLFHVTVAGPLSASLGVCNIRMACKCQHRLNDLAVQTASNHCASGLCFFCTFYHLITFMLMWQPIRATTVPCCHPFISGCWLKNRAPRKEKANPRQFCCRTFKQNHEPFSCLDVFIFGKSS